MQQVSMDVHCKKVTARRRDKNRGRVDNGSEFTRFGVGNFELLDGFFPTVLQVSAEARFDDPVEVVNASAKTSAGCAVGVWHDARVAHGAASPAMIHSLLM